MSLQTSDFVMNTETNLLTDATSQKQIVWLASYPKSGNTWFRSFLTALLKEKEVDLNQMVLDGIFSGKNYFENITKIICMKCNVKPRVVKSFFKFAHLRFFKNMAPFAVFSFDIFKIVK